MCKMRERERGGRGAGGGGVNILALMCLFSSYIKHLSVPNNYSYTTFSPKAQVVDVL